jgi:GST-like protein
MFVASGVGPYSGQSVHFQVYAPESIPYAVNRYRFEARRHFAILDERLAGCRYVLGDNYTIVDMAVWGWARLMPRVLDEAAWDGLPNLKRLVDEIAERPAARRAVALGDRYAFKTEQDADANRFMFPSNVDYG